jgi:hypothetical protein
MAPGASKYSLGKFALGKKLGRCDATSRYLLRRLFHGLSVSAGADAVRTAASHALPTPLPDDKTATNR